MSESKILASLQLTDKRVIIFHQILANMENLILRKKEKKNEKVNDLAAFCSSHQNVL